MEDLINKEEFSMRDKLGNFSSIVCLRAIVVGLEDVLGVNGARANLILAGRIRGRNLIKAFDLANTDKPLNEWSAIVKDALGHRGTRLCTISKVEQINDSLLRMYLNETVCSAGEEQGSSRELTFTLGVMYGIIEEITGNKLQVKQTGSVLRGQDYDIIDFQKI